MTTLTIETATFRTTGEILALVRGFDDCTLPRERWTHAAHLTVALWNLLQYDWPEASARVRAGIKRYNAAHAAAATPTTGYHETLTLFWLRRVRSFLEDGRNEGRGGRGARRHSSRGAHRWPGAEVHGDGRAAELARATRRQAGCRKSELSQGRVSHILLSRRRTARSADLS